MALSVLSPRVNVAFEETATYFVVGEWTSRVKRAHVPDCWGENPSWRSDELHAVGCVHIHSSAAEYPGSISHAVLMGKNPPCCIWISSFLFRWHEQYLRVMQCIISYSYQTGLNVANV